MYYIPVMFTVGLLGQHYQRVADGHAVEIVDAGGNAVELPEICEYHVNGEPVEQLPELH